MIGREVKVDSFSTILIICFGPIEQLKPIALAPKASKVFAMLSKVQPVNVRSFSLKDIVTKTGKSLCSLAAKRAAFVS